MRGQDGGRRRFVGLGGAFVAAGLWPPAPAQAAAAMISASGGGRTRIEVPLDPGTAWRLSAAKDPPRLVLDLPGMAWRGPARLPAPAWCPKPGAPATPSCCCWPRPWRARHRRAAATVGDRAVPRHRRRLRPARRRPRAGRRAAAAPDAAAGGPRPRPRRARPRRGRRGRHAGKADHPFRGARSETAIGGRRALPRAADPRARRVRAPRGPDRLGAAAGSGAFPIAPRRFGPRRAGRQRLHLSETASDALSAALARRENEADRAGGLRLPSVSPDVERICSA
jgi:N-acetylmuramoyl-L-alanine amidase